MIPNHRTWNDRHGEYERVAENLARMFTQGHRIDVLQDLGTAQRNQFEALAIAVIMADRMSPDNRQRFIGCLAAMAMAATA